MVSACLISTTMHWENGQTDTLDRDDPAADNYDSMDGPSEEEAYRQGDPPLIIIFFN